MERWMMEADRMLAWVFFFVFLVGEAGGGGAKENG